VIAKISQLILTCFLILILGLIPHINITDYIQSTITSKFIIFVYGCLTITLFSVPFALFYRTKTIYISKLDVSLLLLFVYITLNKFVFQIYSSFSFRYIELLGLAVIYLTIRIIETKHLIWILCGVLISGTIQAIHGNLQLLGYYPSNHSGFKMTGSFFNPGPYAGFLAAVLPIAFGLYLFKNKIKESMSFFGFHKLKMWQILTKYFFEYMPFIGLVSILIVLPASRSRAAWLAVILSSLVLMECRYSILNQLYNRVSKLKKLSIVVIGVIILATGLYGTYNLKKGSSDGRLFIWNVCGQIIKNNPLQGVGFDRFKAHYMNYQAEYFNNDNESSNSLVADNSYYAFNEFLQFVVEEGFLGTILLVWGMVLTFRTKTKDTHQYLGYIVIAGIITIAVFAFFSYPMQILPIKLVLVTLIAILASLDKNKWWCQFKESNNIVMYFGKLISICCLFYVLVHGFVYTKTIDQALKNWQTAFTTYNYSDYESALEAYRKAYPYLKKDGDFLMNYGKTLTMAKNYDEAVVVLKEAKQHLNTTIIETALGDAYMALKNYDEAEKAYKNAADMIPVRFYPLYLLAKLYEESGQDEKAITMATLILEKDVKIPSTAIREMRAEMKKMISNITQNNTTN
jgi:O-antigen polymerase